VNNSQNKIYLSRSWLNLCKLALARVKVMNNEHDIDVEQLYNYVAESRIEIHEGQMRKYIAEILLNLEGNHLEAAEKWT